jgi:CheY-like chemotaxis protein
MSADRIYKILYVEDDQTVITMVKAMLVDKKFEIDVAMNGSEAVTMAFRGKYDIILTDIMMPVMNGLEAAKTIKNMSPNVPILAVTSYDIVDLSKDKQIDDVLRKPVRKEELKYKIIEMIHDFENKNKKES